MLTLLPIVLNTVAGLRSVPSHLIEAARGMGMTAAQILSRVELPNAVFVILAGVRTAMAINIGTVPLAFLIGGGGLGELIFTGIDLMEPTMLLAGAIPTALLAVARRFRHRPGAVLAGSARRQSAAMSGRPLPTEGNDDAANATSLHSPRPRSRITALPLSAARPDRSWSAARTSPSSRSWPR